MFQLRATSTSSPDQVDFFKLVTKRPPAVLLAAIFAYVIVYRIATPPINALIFDSGAEHLTLRTLSNALLQLALFFPILFLRRVGLFHPLAFPSLYNAAFDVVFQPLHLFAPFLISFRPFLEVSTSYSIHMAAVTPSEYAVLNIKSDLINTLFVICTYLGFAFASKVWVPRLSAGSENFRAYASAAKIYLVITIAIAAVFIASRGGIESQILSFYQGRYETLSGMGAFFAPVKAAIVALMLWVAVVRRPGKDFWILFIVLAPLYWLVDGSRSSLIVLVLSCLVVHAMRNHRIPRKALIVSAVFAFLAFGLLGILRHDFKADSVDFSVLSVDGIIDAVEASQAETSKRNAEEADIAVIRTAEDFSGYLLGRSYLSILAFPIPRAVWPNKPKNIYTYVNWVAFQGNPMDSFAPHTWGIPIDPSTEAYWNFGYLGVVCVGLFVGLGLCIFYKSLKLSPSSPWILVIYIQSLLYVNGGSRWAFYFIQNSITLFVIVTLAAFLSRFYKDSNQSSAGSSR